MEGIEEKRNVKCKESNFEYLNKLHHQLKNLYKLHKSQKKTDEDGSLVENIQDLHNRMIKKIDSLINLNYPLHLRLLAMKMVLLYEHTKFLVSLKRETEAEKILNTAIGEIKPVILKPEITYLGLNMINHYSYLLSKKENFNASKEILEFAKSLYETLKVKNSTIQFYSNDELYSPKDEISAEKTANDKLEVLVTSNLQMLAFVYNKLELTHKYAICCHEILKRQLLLHNGNITTWAQKCARLASYFLENNRYNEARHHLSAAIHVLYLYEKELKTIQLSDDAMKKWEDLHMTFANVANCWVKYGLFLFSVSKHNAISHSCQMALSNAENTLLKDVPVSKEEYINSILMDKKRNSSMEVVNTKVKSDLDQSVKSNKLPENDNDETLYFESLDLSEYEDQVPAAVIKSINQARTLYLHTYSWIRKAQAFFTLNDHPMEHVNTILDLSELYRYLVYFEEDLESQYSTQKLRAEAIETLCTILKEVSPQCYLMVSIELYRELAEIQLEMMGLNLKRICIAQENTPESCETIAHKAEAVADVYSKLEQLGDDLGHNVMLNDSLKLSEADALRNEPMY